MKKSPFSSRNTPITPFKHSSPISASTYLSTLSSPSIINPSPSSSIQANRTGILHKSRSNIIEALQKENEEKTLEIQRLYNLLRNEEKKLNESLRIDECLLQEKNEHIDKLYNSLEEKEISYQDFLLSTDQKVLDLNEQITRHIAQESLLKQELSSYKNETN